MIMYRQVLKDKSKIEETVAKLDEYKKEALQTTWEKVDAYANRPPSRRLNPSLTLVLFPTASLATSLPSYYQGTFPSSFRPKAWTLRRASRSRCGWGQSGRPV